MFKKLKDILGIEGVKMTMHLPESVRVKDKSIKGTIEFYSQNDKVIEHLELKLIEKYQRGRGDSKLINEYLLGSVYLDLNLEIVKGETKTIDFDLPFDMMLSEMDRYQKSNPLSGLLVKVAKALKNVKSEYKVNATAKIKGTKLDAVASQKVSME